MLIKSVIIDGKNKLVQITSMSFEEFIFDKYKVNEKDFRNALKKDGFKPNSIEKEVAKLKKDYRKFCNEYSLECSNC